jgi:hypothetical protein
VVLMYLENKWKNGHAFVPTDLKDSLDI